MPCEHANPCLACLQKELTEVRAQHNRLQVGVLSALDLLNEVTGVLQRLVLPPEPEPETRPPPATTPPDSPARKAASIRSPAFRDELAELEAANQANAQKKTAPDDPWKNALTMAQGHAVLLGMLPRIAAEAAAQKKQPKRGAGKKKPQPKAKRSGKAPAGKNSPTRKSRGSPKTTRSPKSTRTSSTSSHFQEYEDLHHD